MSNGLKRATANARATRMTSGVGAWMEEYKCGCSNVTALKNEALGYCPIHGEDKRHIYRLTEPVAVGYTK